MITIGIFTKAKESAIKTEEAQEKEGVNLAVMASQIENETITQDNIEQSIKEQFGNNKKFTIEDEGDSSFIIRFDDTGRMYYVESTGEVTANDNILEINTVDELKAFRDEVNSGNTFEGKVIYLINDITLDISEEWIPIGKFYDAEDESNKAFEGTFLGNNHTIDGIYINTTDKTYALFSLIQNAKIKNLIIGENCNITGGRGTAGLVGYASYESSIINCMNKARIEATASPGGVVGILINNSSVLNSCNLGQINSSNANTCIGGVVGFSSANSKIENCYNAGNISGGKYMGGILGWMQKSVSIKNCYNIASADQGIVGWNYDETLDLDNCYYLENNSNGSVGKYNVVNLERTESYMKSSEFLNLLGSSFKADANNINQGYPILSWQ